MKVRLLQDGKSGMKGDIIEMRPMLAKILIKLSKAVEVYRVDELYYGELCRVNNIKLHKYIEDGVSDITISIIPIKLSILTYTPPKFYKCMLVQEDYYNVIDSGIQVLSDACQNNHRIKNGHIIVDSDTIYNIVKKASYLLDGCDIIDGYITKADIKKIEEKLNKKYSNLEDDRNFKY